MEINNHSAKSVIFSETILYERIHNKRIEMRG